MPFRKRRPLDQQQQQHGCETLICQRHQTLLRFLSSVATASTRWRVRELYCMTRMWILSSELHLCRAHGAHNFELAARFLEKFLHSWSPKMD